LITIQSSNNRKLIEDLFFCDELVKGFLPNGEKIKISFKKYRFFILFWNKIPIGLCIFYPLKGNFRNNFCAAHIGIKRKYRGKEAYKAGRLIIKKLLKLFNGIGIQIQKENRQSLFYALQLGFKLISEVQNYKLLEVKRHG
jgi:hypothetical protein